MTHAQSKLMAAALLFGAAQAAQADIIGGVGFPQGAISFADAVTFYDPAFGGGNVPGVPYQGTGNALGIPDYIGANGCAAQASCTFLTLGAGGRAILRFTDNVLTGSGSSAFDLWIFEIGPDVEDTTVDVSVDGVTWSSVGLVTGSTRGIDLDAFGFGTSSAFSYVRLTDVLNEGATGGDTVGADIDAVGAISTRAVDPLPEPGTWAMMIGGLGLAGGMMRRRQRSWRFA